MGSHCKNADRIYLTQLGVCSMVRPVIRWPLISVKCEINHGIHRRLLSSKAIQIQQLKQTKILALINLSKSYII